MPYVDHETRDRLDHGHPAQTVGELTYLFQQEAQRFLLNKLANGEELSYTLLSAVTAALHNCGVDFEDRILLPYEACKAAENGDVWDARLIATNRDVPFHEPTAVMAEQPRVVTCFQERGHFPHDWAGRDANVIYHCPGV